MALSWSFESFNDSDIASFAAREIRDDVDVCASSLLAIAVDVALYCVRTLAIAG